MQSQTRPSWVGVAFALLAGAFALIEGLRAEEGHHEEHGHDHEKKEVVPDPSERIQSLDLSYVIRRDGTVEFEQRFRLGVAGVAIRRGPVLNYLTVFEGPGGLILDNELEILEVTRDGSPEVFRAEPRDGFTTLFIGASDRDLEHRVHEYSIRGRTQSDWRQGEGEFSAVFDLVGPLPRVPIDSLSAKIHLPEGVTLSQFTPAITGVIDPAASRKGPAFESGVADGVLTVRATSALGAERSFFVNLSWPSETFATKSQWLKVMRQHPRIPLAGFSAFLLLWALLLIVKRIVQRVPAVP